MWLYINGHFKVEKLNAAATDRELGSSLLDITA
jgi:hypothetical protein